MLGIIYKFTMLTNGRFYIGQHFASSKEEFLESKVSSYWGSGKIWGDCLSSLKKKYPKNWTKFIKREVLCFIKIDNPILLNKLEKFWIEKEKAHYSYKLGGCNVILGAAYGEDWVNAMKCPEIRQKVSEKNRISLKGVTSGSKHPFFGKKRSEETRRKISETRKERIRQGLIDATENIKKAYEAVKGKHQTKEHRLKISMAQKGDKSVHYGTHLSEEHKLKMSKSIKKRFENNKPNVGMKHITNGKINKWHNPIFPLPNGWRYGRTLSRKYKNGRD